MVLLTSLVTACGRASEGAHAIHLFEDLRHHLDLSPVSYAAVINACAKCGWLSMGNWGKLLQVISDFRILGNEARDWGFSNLRHGHVDLGGTFVVFVGTTTSSRNQTNMEVNKCCFDDYRT